LCQQLLKLLITPMARDGDVQMAITDRQWDRRDRCPFRPCHPRCRIIQQRCGPFQFLWTWNMPLEQQLQLQPLLIRSNGAGDRSGEDQQWRPEERCGLPQLV
jgi:hypothetical protein